jgi:hypothetical protein
VRNALSPEAALGAVALLVCLPIFGALRYVFGVSFADAIRHPAQNWFAWSILAAWLIGVIRQAFALQRRALEPSMTEDAD